MIEEGKRLIKLRINGIPVEAVEGTTILYAAKEMGIYIPALCHHPKLTPSGACRVCLVEVNGVPVTSCTTLIEDGMEVITDSPYIENMRRDIIDLILSDHPYDCMVCQKTGECELQELAYKYEIRNPIFKGQRRIYTKRDGNPFIERDMEKCILCGRCVKICDEVQGVGAIDFAYKGFQTKVCPPFEHDLNCEFCGQCVMVCPTGALVGKEWIRKGRYWGIREVDTICPYCGVGCSITLHIKDSEIVRVTSKEDRGVNKGLLCVKGRFAYEFVSSPDRLKTPLIRRNGELQPASWNEALDYAASRLKDIKEKHGPDAIGGLSSARCTTEENYLFQKFMRAAVGTNNVDHCARL
jgi:predicted molibdopterin-dependent oxidoreductase YjgC